MDEIKKLLQELEIYKTGKQKDDYYVITLDNYEEFNSVYLRLEHAKGFTRNSEVSFVRVDEVFVQYTKDGYAFDLIGFLDDNDYTLNITEED